MLRRFRAWADVWLAMRIGLWACALPLLKHLLPIRSLVSLMQRPAGLEHRNARLEDQIITFARWGARLIRWRAGGNCLERGLIAYRYLGAAGANPTLVVGIGRNELGVIGHAWVVVDGQPMDEYRAALDIYTPVFAFAPDGSLVETSPAIARESGRGVQLDGSRA
jgi:hypothetical protein